jgi:hypothetical protein
MLKPMTYDRWEQRAGLWVRRRDDGEWDYYPSLREMAAGYRVNAAFFGHIELGGHAGRILKLWLGLPILCFALFALATKTDLGILRDARSQGLLYVVGLVIVVAASFVRPIVLRTTLMQATVSDTPLSIGELRGLAEHIGATTLDDQGTLRPAISAGALSALTFAMTAMTTLVIMVFLVALAMDLRTTMLVTGIMALPPGLVAMRLWRLRAESV